MKSQSTLSFPLPLPPPLQVHLAFHNFGFCHLSIRCTSPCEACLACLLNVRVMAIFPDHPPTFSPLSQNTVCLTLSLDVLPSAGTCICKKCFEPCRGEGFSTYPDRNEIGFTHGNLSIAAGVNSATSTQVKNPKSLWNSPLFPACSMS